MGKYDQHTAVIFCSLKELVEKTSKALEVSTGSPMKPSKVMKFLALQAGFSDTHTWLASLWPPEYWSADDTTERNNRWWNDYLTNVIEDEFGTEDPPDAPPTPPTRIEPLNSHFESTAEVRPFHAALASVGRYMRTLEAQDKSKSVIQAWRDTVATPGKPSYFKKQKYD